MVKVNSISGVVRSVQDLDATATFYEKIGFRFGKREANLLVCYVNWFWVEFHLLDEGVSSQTRTNEQLAVSVEGLDELYETLVAQGIQPEDEPRDQPWGRREFTVTDPDGYTLLFFKKK